RKHSLVNDANILEIIGIMLIYRMCDLKNYYYLTKNLFNLSCGLYQSFLLTCKDLTTNFLNNNFMNKILKIVDDKVDVKNKKEDTKVLLRKINNENFNMIKEIIK